MSLASPQLPCFLSSANADLLSRMAKTSNLLPEVYLSNLVRDYLDEIRINDKIESVSEEWVDRLKEIFQACIKASKDFPLFGPLDARWAGAKINFGISSEAGRTIADHYKEMAFVEYLDSLKEEYAISYTPDPKSKGATDFICNVPELAKKWLAVIEKDFKLPFPIQPTSSFKNYVKRADGAD